MIGKKAKIGFVYSLIGLAAIGGAILGSAKTAFADTTDCVITGIESHVTSFTNDASYGSNANDIAIAHGGSICHYTDSTYTTSTGYDGRVSGLLPLQGIWIVSNATPATGYWAYVYAASSWTNSPTVGYIKFHYVSGSPVVDTPGVDTTTHIVDFNPQNGEVVSIGGAATGTVPFDIHAYINEDDIGNFLSIKIVLRNIDQNTLASGTCGPLDFGLICSSYSFDVFRGVATTSGDFYYSSSAVLAKGNYRVEAILDTATTFLGVNLGAFSFLGAISDYRNHQFIVGSSTFIGNLSQNIFQETDSFFGSLPATSTAALAAQCNPISSNFGIRECLAFLFIPDAQALKNTFEQFRDGILVKVPIGYLTRFFTIMSSSTPVTLPTISFTFGTGPLDGDQWNISPGDMLAEGAALLSSTTDRDGNNIRDVTEPIVKLVVGLALIFGIVHDLTGSHGASVRSKENST